jgi:ABC-type transport system involved in multi-copper enzyme maturation permease subunit
LIPAGGIILFDSSIVYHLIRTYQRLLHVNDIQTLKRQSRTTSWMNIVLILQSLLFLSSLFSHIIGHMMIVETFETWWVSLTVLINCSFNFYIYCLSGKAFRNEIYQSIRKILYILKRQQQQQERCCHYQKYQNVIYEVRYHKNNYRFILIRKTSHWNRLAN